MDYSRTNDIAPNNGEKPHSKNYGFQILVVEQVVLDCNPSLFGRSLAAGQLGIHRRDRIETHPSSPTGDLFWNLKTRSPKGLRLHLLIEKPGIRKTEPCEFILSFLNELNAFEEFNPKIFDLLIDATDDIPTRLFELGWGLPTAEFPWV